MWNPSVDFERLIKYFEEKDSAVAVAFAIVVFLNVAYTTYKASEYL
jgi:hypothetical protein